MLKRANIGGLDRISGEDQHPELAGKRAEAERVIAVWLV
jgi:hypothetical protein